MFFSRKPVDKLEAAIKTRDAARLEGDTEHVVEMNAWIEEIIKQRKETTRLNRERQFGFIRQSDCW